MAWLLATQRRMAFRTRQRRAFANVNEMGLFLDAVAGGDQDDNVEREV